MFQNEIIDPKQYSKQINREEKDSFETINTVLYEDIELLFNDFISEICLIKVIQGTVMKELAIKQIL